MRKHIQKTYPSVLHLLGLTWLDKERKPHFSHVYVGNDVRLSQGELEEVTYIWLRDKIDKRAKRVLGFKILETIIL